MIRLGCLLIACGACALLWHECGENPLVFCYRIGWSAFITMRGRALAPVHVLSRTSAACSNPSLTFSRRSTMWKD
jgi:hypothetical protein